MAGINPFHFEYRKDSFGTFRETYHAHAEMEILYVHQGRGTLILNQQTCDISPGTLILFQPFQLHRVQMTDTEASPFIRTLLIFDPALMEEHLRAYPDLLPFYRHLYYDPLTISHLTLAEDDGLIGLLHTFHQLERASGHGAPPAAGFQLTAMFLRYLMPKWILQEKHCSLQQPRHPHRIEQILDWLELHYREPFRLSCLAKELYLSPHRVSHLFKEMTGTSISAYIASRRIREACLLLKSTQLSVRDIGEKVGLVNVSHFCHMFRKNTGVSPYQFRLQERGKRPG